MAGSPAPDKRPNWLWILVLVALAILALLWLLGTFSDATDAEPDLGEAVGVPEAGTEAYEPAVTNDMQQQPSPTEAPEGVTVNEEPQ